MPYVPPSPSQDRDGILPYGFLKTIFIVILGEWWSLQPFGGHTKPQGAGTRCLGLIAALRSPQRCGPGGFPSLQLLSLLLCFVPRRVLPAGPGAGRVCWLHAGSHGRPALHLEDGPAAPVFLLSFCSPPRHLGKSIILSLARCNTGFSWAWTHFSVLYEGRQRERGESTNGALFILVSAAVIEHHRLLKF